LFWKPENAKLIKIIKGKLNYTNIKISKTPKNLYNGAIWEHVHLYNGLHLVFLCGSGCEYKPTTGLSVMEVFNGRVHPAWKNSIKYRPTNSNIPVELSMGDDIKLVTNEIENIIREQSE